MLRTNNIPLSNSILYGSRVFVCVKESKAEVSDACRLNWKISGNFFFIRYGVCNVHVKLFH